MSQQVGLGKKSGPIRTKPGERFVVKVGSDWDCARNKPAAGVPRKQKMKKREVGFADEFDGGKYSCSLFFKGDIWTK